MRKGDSQEVMKSIIKKILLWRKLAKSTVFWNIGNISNKHELLTVGRPQIDCCGKGGS